MSSGFDEGRQKAQSGETPSWRDSRDCVTGWQQEQDRIQADRNHKAEMDSINRLNESLKQQNTPRPSKPRREEPSQEEKNRNFRGSVMGLILGGLILAYAEYDSKKADTTPATEPVTPSAAVSMAPVTTSTTAMFATSAFKCTQQGQSVTLKYKESAPNGGTVERSSVQHRTGVRIDLDRIAQQSQNCDTAFSKLRQAGLTP